MLSFKSSLEIIFRGAKCKGRSIPNIFLLMAASVGDAATVNPNLIKILLANNLNAFSFKDKPVVGNGFRSLPKKPPDCTI